MHVIGYHASHEQFDPATLLGHVRRAEQCGFDAAMCSDHFHPWSQAQGQSGHAWVWTGAAMAQSRLSFGLVNCPFQRYHPATVAQAAATLDQMYPGRFWMAVGSGEALNERITGAAWPAKPERHARLREAAEAMRALWAGETVTRHGAVRIEGARLYTLPSRAIPVFGAALTPETARWLGSWCDGLITVSMPMQELRGVVEAFKEGGGADKPLYLQVKLSYSDSHDAALEGALQQWRTNVLAPAAVESLSQPAQFEAAATAVDAAYFCTRVNVSADLGRHVAWLQAYAELGFSRLYLHNVNREQARFIDDFGSRVLPQLRAR